MRPISSGASALENEVRHMRNKLVVISARVMAKRAQNKLHLIVEVEDTGMGIEQDEQNKLFHYFEQTTSGREISGETGLGLAISREYAQMMGGDITVRSQLGK